MASTAAQQLSEIYNLLCRSGMNKEYYGTKLHRAQRLNDWLEIVIAVGTTGSGISAFYIWTIQPYGPWIWGALTGVSALLAIMKPIIQLNKKIERLTKLYIGHSDNYANLDILISRIRRSGAIKPAFQELFEAAEAKYLELAKDDDPSPNARLLQKCEKLMRQRHPAEEAWWPENLEAFSDGR